MYARVALPAAPNVLCAHDGGLAQRRVLNSCKGLHDAGKRQPALILQHSCTPTLSQQPELVLLSCSACLPPTKRTPLTGIFLVARYTAICACQHPQLALLYLERRCDAVLNGSWTMSSLHALHNSWHIFACKRTA